MSQDGFTVVIVCPQGAHSLHTYFKDFEVGWLSKRPALDVSGCCLGLVVQILKKIFKCHIDSNSSVNLWVLCWLNREEERVAGIIPKETSFTLSVT